MRLLNVHSMLLEEFCDVEAAPKYAILSHRWGEEEITLQALQDVTIRFRPGYLKIRNCCRQALKENLGYVWIDTCCIDKKDPTELSEAINSMFRWYQRSAICYVYLDDVEADEYGYISASALRKSRWFTRGWTLQELLAPESIAFFDRYWQPLSEYSWLDHSRSHHLDSICVLSSITGIKDTVLARYQPMHTVSAAEKLSWVAQRKTTRKEDMAYCLLGILGVNMPLLYGEGSRAFIRLQEEYIRQNNDPSLLAWGLHLPCSDIIRLCAEECILAPSPSAFAGFSTRNSGLEFRKNVVPFEFARTNNGIEVELLLLDCNDGIKLACLGTDKNFYALYREPYHGIIRRLLSLGSHKKKSYEYNRGMVAAVPLLYCPTSSRDGFEVYERALLWPPFLLSSAACRRASWKRVCVQTKSAPSDLLSISRPVQHGYRIDVRELTRIGFSLAAVYPPLQIDNQIDIFTVPCDIMRPGGYEECHLAFEGPRGIVVGIFIHAQIRYQANRTTFHLNASIGSRSIRHDLHLFPRGGSFSRRIYGPKDSVEKQRYIYLEKSWRIPLMFPGMPDKDIYLSVPMDEVTIAIRGSRGRAFAPDPRDAIIPVKVGIGNSI
ncbi:HET-domain-containing protein [Hypoxylon sp. FL0543]|nr:HET-domain-containing protein [Hypoxylon sp. FL0543]